MSERNKLVASVLSGDDVLRINGFCIRIYANAGDVYYEVLRKGLTIGEYTTLQEAVKWCED